jgi:DDE superfamily endonuclease
LLIAQWLIWQDILHKHKDRAVFKRHLCMSPNSFEKLLSYNLHALQIDERMAWLRGGPILPELRLYCTLRWLAGSSYSDIYRFVGISKYSFYRVCWQTIFALYDCEELKLSLTQTVEECRQAAQDFASISHGEAIVNCIDAIHGYLLHIEAPPKAVVGNVRAYFYGHYQQYGVNIQACCDHLPRFTYISVAGPGVMNDNQAINEVNIAELIANLPFSHCVIGDAAYTATEHLVPMFYGPEKQNPRLDNFNFYVSQLRIRIKMAFGMMQRKWGILWQPVVVPLEKIKYIVEAIA